MSALTRVALVDPSLFTIPYDCELASALGRAGCDVTIYGRRLRRGEALSKPIRLVSHFYPLSERIKAGKAALRRMKGAEHGFEMAALLPRVWAGSEIVHFQWCPLPVIDVPMLRMLRMIRPLVMTVHDPNPYNGMDHGAMSLGASSLFGCFDRLIVHTTHGRDQLIGRGIPSTRIDVIPHGLLPVTRSRPRADRAASTRVNIVAFGKIKPYKGLDLLIEAIAHMAEPARSMVHLIVAGEPAMDVQPMIQRAAQADISIHWDLRFIPDSEIDTYLGMADLFVFPYRDIDASGVMMTAIQYGRAIIATDIGAFRSVLDGIHGRLVPVDDFHKLALAIEEMVRRPASRDLMGRNVQALAREFVGWDDIARLTVLAYYKAISGRS